MKKNTWIQEFSITNDGFYGHLYRPVKDDLPGKALLVLGGGGVPYQCTLDEAEAFAGIGITALAVGYFGVKNAPKYIVRVPIEYVEKAANRLHTTGIKSVIAVGISKGAELTLAAASLLPQINGVIAFSPPSRVYMGPGKGISWVDASSWSFHGKELPYAYAPYSGLKAVLNSIRQREVTFRQAYEWANTLSSADSLIPVEHIQGPVLVVCSASDSLWPSAEACDEIMERLEANNFAYPHKMLLYKYASHLLLPFETGYEKWFCIGRRYPDECRRTVYELQAEVLNWLQLC